MSLLTQADLVTDEQLLEFVRGQRWFGAKGSDVATLRVLDRVAAVGDPHSLALRRLQPRDVTLRLRRQRRLRAVVER